MPGVRKLQRLTWRPTGLSSALLNWTIWSNIWRLRVEITLFLSYSFLLLSLCLGMAMKNNIYIFFRFRLYLYHYLSIYQQVDEDGNLYFSPFDLEKFRPDIHISVRRIEIQVFLILYAQNKEMVNDTVIIIYFWIQIYRCRASNSAGTVIGTEIHTRAGNFCLIFFLSCFHCHFWK